MSRTIRRTKTSKRFPRFEKDYTHKRPNEWRGVEQTGWKNDCYAFPLQPLPGKEYIIAWWKFHSDNGFAVFGFENSYERPILVGEGQVRTRYRNELSKWMKDPDYEIQITRRHSFWDYY